MNSLYLAFTVVFPLFSMMALGYTLKAVRLFNQEFLSQLNNLCFQVFLPLILFVNIYQSDFRTAFSAGLLIFALLSIIFAFILLLVLVPVFEKDNRKRGVVIQGIFRSNFILFGIPISASLYGLENASVTAILIAFIIPLFNLLSVVILEIFSPQKTNFKSIVRGILHNPLIISACLGFVCIFLDLNLPAVVESTIVDISRVATPLALIVLGGGFAFDRLGHSIRALIFSVFAKLLLLPAIFIPISIWLGFRNMELVALLAMFGSPTAVSTYSMAQNAEADAELAGQIVVIDSTLSIFTIFLWISLLKYMAYI